MSMQSNFKREYDSLIARNPWIDTSELTSEIYSLHRNGNTPISDILYIYAELDDTKDCSGSYNLSKRAMLFPSNFNETIIKPNLPCTCAICGEMIMTPIELTLDHKIPLAQLFNGTPLNQVKTKAQRADMFNEITNLQPAHKKCNSSKGSCGVLYDVNKISNCEL